MVGELNVGQRQTLTKKFARALASAAIVGTLALGAWGFADTSVVAGGETRTISLYHQHTKESLTVTYMQNGRYVPSAMKKLNRFFRDWRRNEVTTIDPRTIDVVWEMHADLGSKRPIHIVSGYRSPKTNAFLKRIGRKVAKKSQHMKGKAIDFFFPDVPTAKIRDSAVARRVGGVGYYRSAGGPTGFIHADSGNVRTWGPGMKGSQLASHVRNGKKTIGKRFGKRTWAETLTASADTGEEKKSGGLFALLTGKKNAPAAEVAATPEPVALESAYEADGDELANLTADAAATEAAQAKRTKLKVPPPSAVDLDDEADAEGEGDEPYGLSAEVVEKPAKKKTPGIANGQLAALADSASVEPAFAPVDAEKAEIKQGYPVPKPRLKPQGFAALAALRQDGLKIEPASAPPESQTPIKKPSQVAAASLGSFDAGQEDVIEGPTVLASLSDETGDNSGKSSLDDDLRIGGDEDSIIVKPVIAGLSGENAEPSWWSSLFASAEDTLRKEGLSPSMDELKTDVMPVAVRLGPDGTGPMTDLEVPLPQEIAVEDDELVVNREGKGNLPASTLRFSQNIQ
jgi:uncharacterized protein YcbK (DUF882 family)